MISQDGGSQQIGNALQPYGTVMQRQAGSSRKSYWRIFTSYNFRFEGDPAH